MGRCYTVNELTRSREARNIGAVARVPVSRTGLRTSHALVCLLLFCSAGRIGADCVGWAGFAAPVRYPSPADQALLVRDLDGDGAPDIIASGNQVDEQAAFALL